MSTFDVSIHAQALIGAMVQGDTVLHHNAEYADAFWIAVLLFVRRQENRCEARVGIEPGFAVRCFQAEHSCIESEACREIKSEMLTRGDFPWTSFLPARRVGKNGG